MSNNSHVFSSSVLQFGFKKEHSTTQYTFLVVEVVEIYNAHESPVCMVAKNYVMSKFGCCSADIRHLLFKSYCDSYYGSPLWDLSGSYINRLHCTWRKYMRCNLVNSV